jgi:hypothetical protein
VGEKVHSIEVRCLTCGSWFRAPISMDDFTTFETCILLGNRTECPQGHITGCDKENMRVRFEGGGFRGAETLE